MTTTSPGNSRTPDPAVGPEALALRARPQPIIRTNRKVLIGGAAVVLLMISGIVLVALKPPTLRAASPQELINTEHKSDFPPAMRVCGPTPGLPMARAQFQWRRDRARRPAFRT